MGRARLMAQAEGQNAFPLLPAGEHSFGASIDPTIRVTFVMENGVATKMLFEQGGGKFEAPKVPRVEIAPLTPGTRS
jgi:hypothetical protein